MQDPRYSEPSAVRLEMPTLHQPPLPGADADTEGDSLTLTFMCADCELKRFSVVESFSVLERCPFCSGAVVPSGYSFVGQEGYHLGSKCHTCAATIQTYTHACAAIPWQ